MGLAPRNYTLGFFYTTNGSDQNVLTASWDGTTLLNLAPTNSPPNTLGNLNGAWQFAQFNVTATGDPATGDTLAFSGSSNSWNGWMM